MKINVKQLLGLAAESTQFGGINDALSFVTKSVDKRYGIGEATVLSEEELQLVAGGIPFSMENKSDDKSST